MQCIEGIHDQVKELTVYQRTPNLATQRKIGHYTYSKESEDEEKKRWPDFFAHCDRSSTGQTTDWEDFDLQDDQLRRDMLEQKWQEGNFWFGNHRALLNDEAYNREVYDFWRAKVAHRIKDPRKRELLAPETPPHPFGAKRPSHETVYYDAFNQDNVNLVDLNTDEFLQVDETGITNKQSGHKELDIIILATGFDAIVGSILNGIDIRGRNGATLYKKWNTRIRTNHGLSVAGFPNFFYIAGPQAPTVFGTTPRLSEIQAPFIAHIIRSAGSGGVIDPDEQAEEDFDRECERVCPKLMWQTRTWYMRRTDFGRGPVQPACWYGGMAEYRRLLQQSEDKGFEGFHISHKRTEVNGETDGYVNGVNGTHAVHGVEVGA